VSCGHPSTLSIRHDVGFVIVKCRDCLHGWLEIFGAFSYLCVERDRKRDPSNVVAGAIKLIEDALQAAELLPNDGWAQVTAIAPFWDVGDPPGVLVAVGEVALSKAALVQRWEMGRAA
jgi:hypothetical protein